MRERRKFVRLGLVTDVDIKHAAGRFTCVSHNISGEGIRVRAEQDISMGSELTMSFCLPGEEDPITVPGIVVWSRRLHEGLVDIGIDFVRMTAEDRTRVVDYIEERLTILGPDEEQE